MPNVIVAELIPSLEVAVRVMVSPTLASVDDALLLDLTVTAESVGSTLSNRT